MMFGTPQQAQGPYFVVTVPEESRKNRGHKRSRSRGRGDGPHDMIDAIEKMEKVIDTFKNKFKPKEEKKEEKKSGIEALSPFQLSVLMMVFTPFIGMAYLGALIMIAKAAMSTFGMK